MNDATRGGGSPDQDILQVQVVEIVGEEIGLPAVGLHVAQARESSPARTGAV